MGLPQVKNTIKHILSKLNKYLQKTPEKLIKMF